MSHSRTKHTLAANPFARSSRLLLIHLIALLLISTSALSAEQKKPVEDDPIVTTSSLTLKLKGHAFGKKTAIFSPDGKHVACASGRIVRVWDAKTGMEVLALKGFQSTIRCIAYTPDGSQLATATYDLDPKMKKQFGVTTLWNVRTGKKIREFRESAKEPSSVSFSPDGKRIITAGLTFDLRVWDVQTGKEIRTLPTKQSHVWYPSSVSYSRDGKLIVAGGSTGLVNPATNRMFGKVKIWDAQSGKELLDLEGHQGTVYTIAISPNAKLIASGSYDQTVRLWDVKKGKEIATLKGHQSYVDSVAFSPDGKFVLSAGGETVRLWDVASGKELMTLREERRSIDSVSFSPDGKRILTAGNDSIVKVWEVSTRKLSAWIADLKSKSATTRLKAVKNLAQAGPKAKAAVVPLFESASTASEEVRDGIGVAIMAIGDVRQKDVPALLAIAMKKRDLVGYGAWYLLQRSEKLAKKNTPELLALLKSKTTPVPRYEIIVMLKKVGADAGKTMPALLNLLKTSEDEQDRDYAWDVLRQLGADLVPTLETFLTGKDVRLRRESLMALSRIGAAGRRAFPVLLERLKKETDPACLNLMEHSLLRWGTTEDVQQVVTALNAKSTEFRKLWEKQTPDAILNACLKSGMLNQGEKVLAAKLGLNPKDSEARYALGVVRFFRAIERLWQTWYRYGLKPKNNGIPFLQLPIAQNPKPEEVSYHVLRRTLDQFHRDLADVDRTLAPVKDNKVKLSLRLAHIHFDLDGDGKPTDQFLDLLKKMMGRAPALLKNNPDFLLRLDRADVSCVRANCHLLMGILDLFLAIDLEPYFNILHAAKNEVGSKVWKLWVIKDSSFSLCSLGIFATHPSMASQKSAKVA